MFNSSVPKTVRYLIIISAAFLIASLGISGVNAYVTLAAPPQAPFVPATVGFEGQLADANGSPVADGNYRITFRLYDAASGGTQLWEEIQTSVPVTDGLYSVQLGSVTPLNATHFEGPRWLGIRVESDSEMTPRIPISAVPFALNAQQAMGIQGYDVSTAAPANNNVLKWDGTNDQWSPGSVLYTLPSGGTQTISSDAITVEGGYFYLVDTEGSAETDDLSTINGGEAGDIIMLQAANAARKPVLKDGIGNIMSPGDIWLNEKGIVSLRYDGSDWHVFAPYDRYVTMWFVTYLYDNGFEGNHASRDVVYGGAALTTILVPDDFGALVSLEMLIAGKQTTDFSYRLYTSYGNPAALELYNHHSESQTENSIVSLVAYQPTYIDVSGMVPALAAGDVVGLRYVNKTSSYDTWVLGIRLVYERRY